MERSTGPAELPIVIRSSRRACHGTSPKRSRRRQQPRRISLPLALLYRPSLLDSFKLLYIYPISLNPKLYQPTMFGTTSRDEIYGRRPSQSDPTPPAPLLAFRDFSKEVAEKAKSPTSPVSDKTDKRAHVVGSRNELYGHSGTKATADAAAAEAERLQREQRNRYHVAGSRGELYGRRPSLVGPDGHVPPAGAKIEENAVAEEEEEGEGKGKGKGKA